MEPTFSLIVAIAVVTICITAFAIYTAFGPPSKELQDPYEMHED
ncbi:photosystem II reaction center protein PsbN [Thermostichus vulcanus]|uniref:Protein PsbN n=1 Tax=Thermostichus vulcanus str. 'Rupite' TaxID=2813851 RepID=A0ABT0CC50_THEVL|nr:photosystem II reaction center protein PsbN [Thermostichus vulcanus]MCJ2543335.1 photosystem II reaction center protein PsbN [Thermostichus vulcanus str. 'Rupite']